MHTAEEIPAMNNTAEQHAPNTTARGITEMSATALTEHIASGDITAREVVEAHIERIEEVNPRLNAVVVKRYDAARAEAAEADRQRRAGRPVGLLHGLPVTVKECLDLEGTASTFGIPSRAGHRAESDELHVSRLRQAGAIVLGKTNVAQLLFYYESDNPLYGRSLNPWNVARTPGGSSGGEAAIIATGGSALGLGTDIGGSVRIPAAFCGLASIKPTAGRAPDPGRFSVPYGQQAVTSQVGVMARHVEDVALGLEVINGGRDPQVEPPMPLGDYRAVDVRQLRIAFYTDDGSFGVAPAVRRTVEEAAQMLRKLGAQVTAWTPPDALYAQNLLYGVFVADGGAMMKKMLGGAKRTPQIAQLLSAAGLPRPITTVARLLLNAVGQHGLAEGLRGFGHRDTAHYWRLVEEIADYRDRFADSLDQASGGPFDAILAPVCSLPAFTHGASRELITAGAHACLYNVLGYPAGVVPVSRVREDEEVGRTPTRDMIEKTARGVEQGSAGLPIGVQVIARQWREHVVLGVMNTLQQVARSRTNYPTTPISL
jgi:fatty acid amide hydrolase